MKGDNQEAQQNRWLSGGCKICSQKKLRLQGSIYPTGIPSVLQEQFPPSHQGAKPWVSVSQRTEPNNCCLCFRGVWQLLSSEGMGQFLVLCTAGRDDSLQRLLMALPGQTTYTVWGHFTLLPLSAVLSPSFLACLKPSILQGPGHLPYSPWTPLQWPQAKTISPISKTLELTFPMPLIYHLSYAALHCLFSIFCLRAWLAFRAEIISYSSLYPPHCLA